MVRLKIAYWEFDFEAVCPTLDHDLLSQAHIYCFVELQLEALDITSEQYRIWGHLLSLKQCHNQILIAVNGWKWKQNCAIRSGVILSGGVMLNVGFVGSWRIYIFFFGGGGGYNC